MASANDEIVAEFRFLKAYSDGRVELSRPDWEKISPSDDPTTGVRSKDVVISKDPPISARVFLPKHEFSNNKFPLLIYIHGGAFCMQSAFTITYHQFCSRLSAEAGVVIVSVEYGLFPARPIPACYEDSWVALKWVASHAHGAGEDQWLNEHADFAKVFLGGDSAGGNISHTVAVRVRSEGLPAVKLVGMLLVHPFFGGTYDDEFWLYLCPSNNGLHDRRLKPAAEDLDSLVFDRVLVIVAERDHLNSVGKEYYEKLKKSSWQGSVELIENEGEEHCFHLQNPHCRKAEELNETIVTFLKH